MLYNTMYMGGVLVHADRANHKYIKKVKTKTGKWRYIYTQPLNQMPVYDTDPEETKRRIQRNKKNRSIMDQIRKNKQAETKGRYSDLKNTRSGTEIERWKQIDPTGKQYVENMIENARRRLSKYKPTSLSGDMDYNKMKKEMNDTIKRQDENFASVEVQKQKKKKR